MIHYQCSEVFREHNLCSLHSFDHFPQLFLAGASLFKSEKAWVLQSLDFLPDNNDFVVDTLSTELPDRNAETHLSKLVQEVRYQLVDTIREIEVVSLFQFIFLPTPAMYFLLFTFWSWLTSRDSWIIYLQVH